MRYSYAVAYLYNAFHEIFLCYWVAATDNLLQHRWQHILQAQQLLWTVIHCILKHN